MKYWLIVLMVLMGKFTFAHQPDLSTIIFSKASNGKIVMQITSSLTAFQGEVNYHNPKDSYKTPEDFRNLVIKHFQDNFSIIANDDQSIKFIDPMVILGHETKIVAEVSGMPKNIESFYIKNDIFKDIHNNQAIVIFSLEGFPAKRNFVLSNDNEHILSIYQKNGIWEINELNDSYFYWKYAIILAILTITAFVLLVTNKRRTLFPIPN